MLGVREGIARGCVGRYKLGTPVLDHCVTFKNNREEDYALIMAIKAKKMDMVALLLERGFTLGDQRLDEALQRPLQSDNSEAVEFLVKKLPVDIHELTHITK